MFDLLWAWLLFAVRFLALDPIPCEIAAAVSERYSASPLPFIAIAEPVVDAALAGGDVVVVSGRDAQRRVLRSTPRGGMEVLMQDTQRLAVGGEYLFARGTRWWYGVAGTRDGDAGTFFVSDDGTSTRVPVSGLYTYLWLPLKSDAPRALELSTGVDGEPIAAEIDTAGSVRSWHLPMLLGRATAAEIVADGRIALVTQQKASGRLTLLLLGDEDRVDIIALGYKMILQLATAVDASGRLAIATATTDRRVDGAVIDPDHATEPKWRELRQGIRLGSWAGELQVTPAPGGFVVAWINHSESPPLLEAGSLSAGSAGGEVFTIGEVADRSRDTCFSLRTEDNEPVVTWDDGNHLVTRRLPASIPGNALIERLSTWYCGPRRAGSSGR
jgi:hypothetical protein